jgi:hypothetical protein
MEGSYHLQSSVMGSAGSPGTSTGFRGKSTMAQPTPIGTGSSGDENVYAGFWAKPWVITGILETESEVFTNRLLQNCPNPFHLSTTIAYTVARESHVELTIFSIRGRRVKTLVNETAPPGVHSVTWDMRNETGEEVSPGVYFYLLKVGSYRSVKKMVVVN